jgi:hypothetical protein
MLRNNRQVNKGDFDESFQSNRNTEKEKLIPEMRQHERRSRGKGRNDKRRDNLGISETRNAEEKAHTRKHFLSFFITRDGWKRVDERAKKKYENETQKEKQINNEEEEEEEEGKTFVVGRRDQGTYVQPNSKRR